MNSLRKKQLVYWVNIGLLMINTALFVLFFPFGKKEAEKDPEQISLEFLREELKLTDEQYKQLAVMDKSVIEKHQVVLKLLCANRYRLLNELAKPNPSVDELNRIASSVGFLHRALKKQTIYHLLNVKKICTPEQVQKLNKIFIDLLEINKHCNECKYKCSSQQKCKRCPNKIFPYDNQAEEQLRLQEKDSVPEKN